MLKRLLLIIPLLLVGCSQINEKSQELKAENENTKETLVTTKENTEQLTTEEVEVTSSDPEKSDSEEKVISKKVRKFTFEEEQAMQNEFLAWADKRARTAGLGVTKLYFSHGAGGSGDWYMASPDGDVQVQDLDNPGFEAFEIHAVTGVTFFETNDGEVGDVGMDWYKMLASGYAPKLQPGGRLHKYILADNGRVYEIIYPTGMASGSSGFGEYADSGQRGDFEPDKMATISGDQAAQQKWQEILNKYE